MTGAIFYGSPGIEATTPQYCSCSLARLRRDDTDDPIQYVYDAARIINQVPYLDPLLGAGAELSGTGDFGPNPATNQNLTRLGTGPVTMTVAPASPLDGAQRHSAYPR
ncbi:hypothetical protein [Mycolicibacterium mengxianglii]|uniref:hypothetical protein n=1 Tax=Mycolicibacterium mengxianglii TaxID=2736649 RepID=UPI0018D0F859|nr:hypothetical protein [Mycolicibacterium mengxianglii]